MVDSFFGLRHHVVIGSHNDDGDIRCLGTAGTHGGKRFVTRSIEERNLAPVFQCHVVSTDMLRDTTRLTGNNICLTDIVEQRGLTVVYVTHHRYNRSTRLQIFLGIFFLNDCLSHFRTYIFCLETEFFRYHIDCFRIQTLVDGNHHADAHTSGDNLRNGNIHHARQLIGSHELGQLQYLAFRHFLVFQFLHTAGCHVTFLLTVFRTLILAFGSEACQSFLYLLCHILFTYFLLDYRFLEAVFILVLTGLLVITPLLAAFQTIVSATLEVGCIVDIHLFLVNADALFLAVGIVAIFRLIIVTTNLLDNGFLHQLLLILALLFFFFTLFPLFLFRFLLRTCRLIQRSKVYLSDDVNLRYKLRLMYFEYFFFFFFIFRNSFFGCSGSRLRVRNRYGFCSHRRCFFFFCRRSRFNHRSRCRLGLRFGNGFRFRSLNNRCRFFRLYFFNHRHLRFHRFFLFFHSMFAIQFIQINLPDRLKLRTYIFGNHSLYHLFSFRLFLCFLVITVNSHRCLVAFLTLTFLNETLRFQFKILICTKLFHKQVVLLVGNLRIGICFNGISLLLQELNYRRDSYI